MAARITVRTAGIDSNVFVLAGHVAKALRQSGQGDKVKEMMERLMEQHSYQDALKLFNEYVDLR